MRLFIAFNFEDEIKTQIKGIIKRVKSNSIQGKFVNEEHMHLTVEFLGEIENKRVGLIKEILTEPKFEPFSLRLTKIGCFKRYEGDIYWLGIEKNDALLNIYKNLHQRLIDEGFEVEDREYKPHITIGRRVKMKENFNPVEIDIDVRKIKIETKKIDLIKSENVDGKLIYSILPLDS
jgi:2'-5' RNA ligase